jgi:hemoglobin-like flavoprotein
MDALRTKFHQLIDQLAEEELLEAWDAVYELHCDFLVLQAIQVVKRSHQPWDTLTYEEAIRLFT